MTRIPVTLVLAAALLALLFPDAAQACAMCLASGAGGTSKAFATGSIFLSITPLATIGGLVWYVRRRARALNELDDTSAPREMPISRSSSSR